MTKFQINQKVSGVEIGIYEGTDKNQALDAMAQDAGYANYDDLLEVTGETRDTHTLEVIEVIEVR